RTQSDFVDDNLYGVSLRLKIPSTIHRSMTFQELPASFRYDRNMIAIGINSHVEGRVESGTLRMAVESVPCSSIPRLEAREIPGADPTFQALEADPLPILRVISHYMGEYDKAQWEAKLRTLAGLERTEADAARAQFRFEIERFERGINVLEDQR